MDQTLAIKGGKPLRNKPFAPWPPYDQDEKNELLETLQSRNWGGFPSPNTKAQEFAKAFAEYHGAKFGICAANGTVTLELILKAAGIKAGDEVIVPCLTWLATAAAPVYINAVPVFVDVTKDNLTIDCDLVEKAITPKTKAIIAVHLGSCLANLDRLKEICKKHQLLLIEDCAHVHGAKWNNKGVGSHGDFGSFSFQSSKLMTAGEGGIILTNDKIFEEKLQSLVNCGRKEPGYNSFSENLFGYNYRISEFQAGVLLAQLKKLSHLTALREKNGKLLSKLLAEIEGITLLKQYSQVTQPTHYQFVFKYDKNAFKGVERNKFLMALKAEGVDAAGAFYQPLHEWEMFRPCPKEWPSLKKRYPQGISANSAHTPVAHQAAYDETVWLHYHYLIGSEEDVHDIANAIKKIQNNIDQLL
ncbi:L-glutamine:2-deoxy-scyllo-inosose aminotransferase [Candidatus Rubidus massiliensis]|nr:L-glutamine:2-deoxy-scyllo-inosose aminotransferase [Candidatus Rubidus massiliensis]